MSGGGRAEHRRRGFPAVTGRARSVPSAVSAKHGRWAKWRSPRGTDSKPSRRRIAIARLRRIAIIRGPCRVRIWLRSSSKVTLRTQWLRFSIDQWPQKTIDALLDLVHGYFAERFDTERRILLIA